MSTPESNQPEKPASNAAQQSSKGSVEKHKTSTTKQRGQGTVEKKEQPKRRVSRREKDERNTKILYAVLGVAAAAIVLAIGGQALNQYYFIPNKTLASVNGHDISREDYWKYRSNTLVNQISQYQQYANVFTGDQQQQYLAMAQQASAQLDEVWGSKSTDPATLNAMIDDQLYIDGLASLGLSMSDEDVQNFIDDRFANPEAPLFTPTPTPTLIPERAAWATGTVEADAATQTAIAEATVLAASPEAGASPSGEGTPVGPVAVESPEATPESSPASGGGVTSPVAGSPVADGASPTSIPMATPGPTETPNQDQVRQTATANFDTYSDQVFDLTHMNRDDYMRLVAKPALARELVNGYFQEQVGQSAEQVHARHILVGTQELADKLYADLQADPSQFEALAIENSIDTGTAPNGGDLGWFTKGVMVAPFEDVAFELANDEISEPVQTQFGWHIIQVLDHEENRALTDEQISQTVQAETDRWLTGQRDAAKISSTVKPTPTPATEQFVPPADAPTPAPASPVPAASGEQSDAP